MAWLAAYLYACGAFLSFAIIMEEENKTGKIQPSWGNKIASLTWPLPLTYAIVMVVLFGKMK